MAETPGQRLYLIRLACGDGVRTPESIALFIDRVRRRTKRSYTANAISLLERMEQKWKLEDINNFASVDPRNRGAPWLAWGEAPAASQGGDVRVTDEELAEAHRVTDAKRSAENAKLARGGKRGRKR